jgi:hypothetical protein
MTRYLALDQILRIHGLLARHGLILATCDDFAQVGALLYPESFGEAAR